MLYFIYEVSYNDSYTLTKENPHKDFPAEIWSYKIIYSFQSADNRDEVFLKFYLLERRDLLFVDYL